MNGLVASAARWHREQPQREAESDNYWADEEANLRRSITADDVLNELYDHLPALDKLLSAGDALAVGEMVLRVKAEYTERLLKVMRS